jgi:hypothetical protein
MRQLLLFLGIIATFCFTSCRNELDFESSIGTLTFSKETVYLDTVFTNIGSSTYTLKVYNNSNKNISIPKVRLGKGQSSNYRLMVDGIPGKEFENVELLAKDSLFVFIEITSNIANANPTDFLYTDRIEFGETNNYQKVELVTLIQDAVFIYPDKQLPSNIKETLILNGESTDIEGHELNTFEELHWTNEKPYVIYGYALVPNGSNLVIDKGTKVHFHSNSGLIIDDNGLLNINGELNTYNSNGTILENKEVTFEGDRLEPNFSEVPGQWGTILILSGNNNTIEHLTLRNASVGIFLQRISTTTIPKLRIKNTQIYNCTNYGILGRTSDINGQNLVINYCGVTSLACSLGGNYNFKQCTIANYWSSPNQTCLTLDNYDGTPPYNLNAQFDNCIIYGSSNISFLLVKNGTTMNYKFNNCLIKFRDFNNQFGSNSLYNFNDITKYSNCLISNNSNIYNPNFKNSNKNQFNLLQGSSAIGAGVYDVLIPKDILGIDRPLNPDLGAYQTQ